mgnify:CR=1 FL=1
MPSTKEDCVKLSQKDYQSELCFSIFCGIMEYIKKYNPIEHIKTRIKSADSIINKANTAAESISAQSDKKMEAGKIKFVLLHGIGNAYVDKTVSDEELKEIITRSAKILNIYEVILFSS